MLEEKIKVTKRKYERRCEILEKKIEKLESVQAVRNTSEELSDVNTPQRINTTGALLFL